MPSPSSKKILLVPLDWGLGHTTRSIPIIQELLALGHEVHLGGSAMTQVIFKEEFSELPFYDFPSYGISYPQRGNKFMSHIVKLLPRIYKAIRLEKKRTQELMCQHNFDIIFSDNRFGVQASGAVNIMLSHQLNLLVPQSKLAGSIANFCNSYFINQFDKVAIPDFENSILSGALSSDSGIMPKAYFLGNLSRWSLSKNQDYKERSGVLVILSGPEPQRTILEDLIIEQSQEIKNEITIVRALPQSNLLPESEKIRFYNHLPGPQLQALVEKSEVVLSRAGYTTIMDLLAVNRHAILIPTPGQTEQEYLAENLQGQNLFLFYPQKGFNLKRALKEFKEKKWGRFPKTSGLLSDRLAELMS